MNNKEISFSEIVDAQERDCKEGKKIDEGLKFYYENKEVINRNDIMGETVPTKEEDERLGALIKKYDAK